ncbi:MAG: rod shape-determining protein MreC [Cyanobacteria bacterium P01_H01_bin.15]
MLSLLRWWKQRGTSFGIVALALIGALWLRQTQGALVVELYYWLSRPLRSEDSSQVLAQLSSARIQGLEQQIVELSAQNSELRKLLGEKQADVVQVAAPIIGRSGDFWWSQVTLGRGARAGIKKGDAVIGIGGLVGRVIQVTPHTSRVLLVSDPASKVGAVVSRSREIGYLEGNGSGYAHLQFIKKVNDVQPGDAIATASVSQLFPAGLTLGKVERVIQTDGPAPAAVVKLTATLAHLEWVWVQSWTGIGELDKTESGPAEDSTSSAAL